MGELDAYNEDSYALENLRGGMGGWREPAVVTGELRSMIMGWRADIKDFYTKQNIGSK